MFCRGSWIIVVLALGLFPNVWAAQAVRLFADSKQSISPVAIAEDADGLLWIAADEGVFRFDGRHFLRLEGPFEGPAAIAVVGDSTVLIGANNGVFQYCKGVVSRLTQEPTNTLTRLSDDLVLVLHVNQWMEAASWDGKQTTMHPQRERTGWAWLSADGTVWQKCGDFGCSLENSEGLRDAVRKGEWTQYRQTHAQLLKAPRLPATTQSFFRSADGAYVFRGVFTGTASVANPNGVVKSYSVGEFTRANGRAGLYPDHTGRIWVPGDSLWVSDGPVLRKLDVSQLDALQVYCVFEDSHGRVWLGLKAVGLALIGSGPVLETWQSPASVADVTSLMRQDSSTLFATTSKGTMLRKRGNANWEQINVDSNSRQLTQLAPGPGKTLVGAIRMGSAAEVSEDGHVLREFADSASIRRLVRAPDGSYFLGTSSQQACLLRVQDNRIEAVKMRTKDGNVQDIVFDRDGSALVGHAEGVCRFHKDSCEPLITQANGLLDPKVRSIGAGADGDIWIAYRSFKGFSRFRLENGNWRARHFTTAEGYETPDTQFMRRDRRGWVWRGTADGLWVSDGVHVEPADWVRISDRDGLPSSAISRFGFLEDPDGTVWIGTERGIAHLNPEPSWFDAKEAVRITALRYAREASVERSVLPGAFEEPSVVTASFSNFGLLPVQYRILPLDHRWEVSYDGEMKPRDLPPGHYELEATAGLHGAVARHGFDVTPSALSRARFAGLVLAPPGTLILLAGIVVWRKRRAASLPPLPDLGRARLAILTPETDRLIGRSLDARFTPHEMIAQGGFGTVFQGQDTRTGELCAIKIFRKEFGDDWLVKRFQQEVAALEAISHPNVVRILGHGTTPAGSLYLAMEFIQGQTLRELLKEGPIAADVCASSLRQMGEALHEIHSRQIYHRDVKPENLMIRKSGPRDEDLVLIDFSMAIVRDLDKSMHGLSRAGGTVRYMAPEQAIGYASCEADLYSLAKVAIEMLTGDRLVDLLPDAGLDLSLRVRELLCTNRNGLSPATIDLLAAALEFDPVRRPGDVRQLTRAIADDLKASMIGKENS